MHFQIISNFTRFTMEIITVERWKYNLQSLETVSDEFKLVKGVLYEDIYLRRKNNFHLYKVVENSPESGTDEDKSNNLMLFHGTDERGVEGILQNGFKNSKEGYFGEGVYLTESVSVAYWYPHSFFHFYKKKHIIFVNEVLGSEKLKLEFNENYWRLKDVSTPIEIPLTKYMEKSSVKKCEENYIKDPKRRRYRNVQVDMSSYKDEFVADCNVVLPRYLVVYQYDNTKFRFAISTIYFVLAVFIVLICSVAIITKHIIVDIFSWVKDHFKV